MTIQEAIRSGKPFRRASFLVPYYFNYYDGTSLMRSDGVGYFPDMPDILATDWEIKREPRTIWFNFYADGDRYAYDTKESAEAAKHKSKGVVRTVKFVEVIE